MHLAHQEQLMLLSSHHSEISYSGSENESYYSNFSTFDHDTATNKLFLTGAVTKQHQVRHNCEVELFLFYK